MLDLAGAEPCEDGQLIVKRTISATGTGRQFVNGSPCTLALLRQIGDALVDLHGPHDHQSLFSRAAQMQLLDAFAGARDACAAFRDARQRWLLLTAEKADCDTDRQAVQREIDLLTHQIQEIENADPRPEDETELPARHLAATHARRLRELAAVVEHGLTAGEVSVDSVFTDVGRQLREMSRLDPATDGFAARAAALLDECRELAGDVTHYADKIDEDPATLAEIESRLDTLELLKRKYGSSVSEVLVFQQAASKRLSALQGRESRREGLDEEIAEGQAQMMSLGANLSAHRKKAAPKLATAVRKHLSDLGFLKAGFEIQLDPVESPAPDGLESVDFVFSPNPGEPPQPLRSIASSGEISRVMLALKTSLAAQDEVPVLVFDEIDANVGGEIARAVAAKMGEIGSLRQVLCITHLPQVASAATTHFVVSKSVIDGRTISTLDVMDAASRTSELARMLGDRKGTAALAHARELLTK
jgi:DNA repair protein RecN (Recombination protein N)